MRIKKVTANNRKRCFEIITSDRRVMEFPYSKLRLKPSAESPVREVFIDPDIGNEGFTYRLAGGREDSVHVDQVLEYNQDTQYARQMLLYKLTLQAQKLLNDRGVRKRELARRLHTSPIQIYRLLDQTFYHKTIDQMVRLLTALDCPVEIVFKKAA